MLYSYRPEGTLWTQAKGFQFTAFVALIPRAMTDAFQPDLNPWTKTIVCCISSITDHKFSRKTQCFLSHTVSLFSTWHTRRGRQLGKWAAIAQSATLENNRSKAKLAIMFVIHFKNFFFSFYSHIHHECSISPDSEQQFLIISVWQSKHTSSKLNNC